MGLGQNCETLGGKKRGIVRIDEVEGGWNENPTRVMRGWGLVERVDSVLIMQKVARPYTSDSQG
jgi:hypothetical protein